MATGGLPGRLRQCSFGTLGIHRMIGEPSGASHAFTQIPPHLSESGKPAPKPFDRPAGYLSRG